MRKIRFLREHMIFVDYVKDYFSRNGYEELDVAIEQAIDRCIEENVLRDFLREHRWEVVKVVRMDYTFDRQLELERIENIREGREEGRIEGRAEGREGLAFELLRKGLISVDAATDILGISEAELHEKMSE